MIVDIEFLKKKIKELISSSGDYSPDGFANAMGMASRGGYYDFINKRKRVSTEELKIISEYFKQPIEYFTHKSNNIAVPVLDADFTASDITQIDDDSPKIIGYVDLEGFRKCKWIVRVKGSSMMPKFVAGDFIGLEPELDFRLIEYGQPYAITTNCNKKLVKIIRKGKDDDHLILRSVNIEYDDINIHRSDIKQLYRVHGPIRDEWQ
jgi:hypothetical protein